MYSLFFSSKVAENTPMPQWLDRDPVETARLRARAETRLSLEDKLFNYFDGIAVEVEPDLEEPTDT